MKMPVRLLVRLLPRKLVGLLLGVLIRLLIRLPMRLLVTLHHTRPQRRHQLFLDLSARYLLKMSGRMSRLRPFGLDASPLEGRGRGRTMVYFGRRVGQSEVACIEKPTHQLCSFDCFRQQSLIR